MKVCGICKEEKDFSFFNKKGNGYQPYCRPCDNKKSRQRYLANTNSHKQKVLDRNRINREKLKKEIRELKSSTPCMDCGIKYPWYVMDFDHVSGEKVDNISTLVGKLSTAKLKVELEKCELVCSNCHRQRTFSRTQSSMV